MRRWYGIVSLVLIANFIGLGLVYFQVTMLARRIPYLAMQDLVKSETEVLTKLTGLQNQLAQTQVDLLPNTSNSSISRSNHFVSIPKNSPNPVNVYQEQAEFSAVLGQLVPDYSYPYYTKLNDWYLVNFTDDKTGWVKAQDVIEKP